MILTSVDLPAPFSPRSAWIWFGRMSISIWSLARNVAVPLGQPKRSAGAAYRRTAGRRASYSSPFAVRAHVERTCLDSRPVQTIAAGSTKKRQTLLTSSAGCAHSNRAPSSRRRCLWANRYRPLGAAAACCKFVTFPANRNWCVSPAADMSRTSFDRSRRPRGLCRRIGTCRARGGGFNEKPYENRLSRRFANCAAVRSDAANPLSCSASPRSARRGLTERAAGRGEKLRLLTSMQERNLSQQRGFVQKLTFWG